MEKFLNFLKIIGIYVYAFLVFLLALSLAFGLARSLLPGILMPIAIA